MNRHGWRRKLKKYLLERLLIGAYVVLGLPLLLIAATFVLTGYAIGEYLRRCPLCGQRWTLHLIANVRPAELDAGDQDWTSYTDSERFRNSYGIFPSETSTTQYGF